MKTTPSSEQRVAVITALAANVAVAIAKFAAAAVTGSSALIAESLHSLADSVNEVLLLVGARRSRRPADLRHPFGYARYRYVYAFVVSLTVFWVGGVLALIQGVSRFSGHDSLGDPRWAYAVLGIAAGFEGWSLRTPRTPAQRPPGPHARKNLPLSYRLRQEGRRATLGGPKNYSTTTTSPACRMKAMLFGSCERRSVKRNRTRWGRDFRTTKTLSPSA